MRRSVEHSQSQYNICVRSNRYTVLQWHRREKYNSNYLNIVKTQRGHAALIGLDLLFFLE